MDADLLSDVVAVLDGDGVDKGGDLLVALLLLDHINSVLKLVLLGDLLGLGRSWHSPTGGLVHKISQGDYFWRWDKSILLFFGLPTIPWIILKHQPTLKNSGCHINFSFSSSKVSQSNKLKLSYVRDMSRLNVIRISFLRGFTRESSWSRWSEWQGWHFDTDII